jgi:hypothetical protein
MKINKINITLIPSACSKMKTRENDYNQREQYGVTVHLFIGTGRRPGKITFVSLSLIYYHSSKH